MYLRIIYLTAIIDGEIGNRYFWIDTNSVIGRRHAIMQLTDGTILSHISLLLRHMTGTHPNLIFTHIMQMMEIWSGANMKRIIIPTICLFALTGLICFASSQPNQLVQTADQPNQQAQESSEQPIEHSMEPEAICSIEISADLAKVYLDYESLAADAELIVKGSVSGVSSFCNTRSGIDSIVDVDVDQFLKGQGTDVIQVYMLGGDVPSAEYYTVNSEKLQDKFTPDTVAQLMVSFSPQDTIKSTFMGVPNLKAGDQVILFLHYDSTINYYRCTGTSYSGQFYFNEAENTVYKIIDGERSMSASLNDLKAVIQNAPDNSAALQIQKANMQPVVKDPTVEPKNPYYDQFKG